MMKLPTKYYFGFGSIILFWIVWEIADKFWVSCTVLFVGNVIWSIYRLKQSAILRSKTIQRNEVDKSVYSSLGVDDHKLEKVKPVLTIYNLLPLGVFIKKHVVEIILLYVIIFGAFQYLLGQPIKNAALSVFGNQVIAKVADSGSDYVDNGRDAGELFYLTCEFSIMGKTFEAYDDSPYDYEEGIEKVKISYLPFNPEVNRFSDREQSPLIDMILCLVSIILPIIFLFYVYQDSIEEEI